MELKIKQTELHECLPAKSGRRLALIGAGGKTTTMLRLAAKEKELRRKVALTTTTKILRSQARGPIISEFNMSGKERPEIFTLAQPADTKAEEDSLKLTSPSTSPLTNLLRDFPGRILIEADGADGAKLKIHRDFEPVIPEPVDALLCLFDLSVLNKKPKKELIHYWPLWKKNFPAEKKVTSEKIEKLFRFDHAYKKRKGIKHWLGMVHPPTPEASELAQKLAAFSKKFWQQFDRHILLSGELSFRVKI